MSDTTFTPGTTITSNWLNDVNDLVYNSVAPTTNGKLYNRINDIVSLKDFGGKGDGVTDNLAAFNAAIASGFKKIHIPFDGGTYNVSDTILIQDKDNIELLFDQGVTLQCVGTYSSGRAGIKLDNSSNIRITNVNIRGRGAGWTGAIADIATSPIDFGIYSTSTGTGAAGNNRFENVHTNYCRITGFCIGNNDPLIVDETTDEHQLYQCASEFVPICVKVLQANTNMTRIIGGWMTDYTQYGIYIGNNARGVTIDNVMLYTFASFGGTAGIYIAKENSGPVSIKNLVTEQYQGTWLTVEPTSSGLTNRNLLTIENCNVTNNDTTVGQNLIDHRGGGSTIIRNSRFGGAGSLRGGTGAQLSFRPNNASIGGTQWLVTELVELYDGATWDVQNTGATGWCRWLDIGSTLRASGVNAGEGALSTPLIRETGRINHEIQNATVINLTPGGTMKSYGKLGSGWWKVTVSYTAFKDAALTSQYYFITLPPMACVKAIYTNTTQAFSGLAGNILLSVQNAGTVLLNQHDVKSGPIFKGNVAADLAAPMTTGLVQGSYMPNPTGTTQLRLDITSSVGNVGNGTVTNLTTGSVDVYVKLDVPPDY